MDGMDSRELVVGAERYKLHLDRRYGCRVWTEPLTQYRQIRQPARIQFRVDQPCQLSFAAAIVGERQQRDGQLARALVAQGCSTLSTEPEMQQCLTI